jgi:hypothetical protein
MPCAMLYHLILKGAVSVATTYDLIHPSITNGFPIIAILYFISLKTGFNRLSKVRLLGGM